MGDEETVVVNEGVSRTVEAVFDRERIDKNLAEKEWPVFNKDLPLSFLEERHEPYLDNWLEIIKLHRLAMTPKQDVDMKTMLDMEQVKLFSFIQARRAIGIRGASVTNERLALVKNVQERIEVSGNSQVKAGLK